MELRHLPQETVNRQTKATFLGTQYMTVIHWKQWITRITIMYWVLKKVAFVPCRHNPGLWRRARSSRGQFRPTPCYPETYILSGLAAEKQMGKKKIQTGKGQMETSVTWLRLPGRWEGATLAGSQGRLLRGGGERIPTLSSFKRQGEGRRSTICA